jgi:translation initiation factor 1
MVTVVEGIDKAQLEQTTKELKHKLACGGTAKDGQIILQGNHKNKVTNALKQLGYLPESIEIR